jgi:hypothetical protein
MKDSKRALRRHHLERIKLLVLEQVKADFPLSPEIWRQQTIQRYRNRTRCSCWMCGNPRRQACRVASKLTRQEQMQALREADETEE